MMILNNDQDLIKSIDENLGISKKSLPKAYTKLKE